MINIFESNEPLELESGYILPQFHLAYHSFGTLNADKSNVVWIFHALTANSNPLEWWPGLVGTGKLINPEEYFIICVNKPGSPYGSLSPLSYNPVTEEPYYHEFPHLTIKDMIKMYQRLKIWLGIEQAYLGIGGSTGGMQALEWAIAEPGFFKYLIPVATNAVMSPWGIAFNASQRMAIEADPTWLEKKEDAGKRGLSAARTIALLSYRHYNGYAITQKRSKEFTPMHDSVVYAADNYQRYQGIKLVSRFNVISYYRLTQSMDSHDVGRGRKGIKEALAEITAKTLVIGIESDVLYPVQEQKYLHQHIKHARLLTIDSNFGHDGFLLEYEKIAPAISNFLKQNEKI